jgi:ubiquinol oxidase
MHYLKIVESLGGDLEWNDRFFAQHAAFFYYWVWAVLVLFKIKLISRRSVFE